jgi:hypothetical protein
VTQPVAERPSPVQTQKCKACSAPIFFVKTAATGKFIPLDIKPERRIWLDKAGKAHSVSVYVPHHSTCPNVDQFRKKAAAQ